MKQELNKRIISVAGFKTENGIFYYNNEKEPYTGIALQCNPFTKIKECKCEYENGKRNGKYEFYYENGNIAMKGEFKDGLEVGSKQFYTEDGKLAYITEVNNIQLDGAFNIMEIDYSYIENKIKINNQKDFFTGTIVRYNENGTIGYICQFENGLKTGKEIWYTSDGIEKEVMNFKNNKLNGEKIDYYESGEVSRIESYKDDILVRSRKYEKNRELIVEDNNSIDEIINFIEYASFKEIQSVLGIYELEFVKEIEDKIEKGYDTNLKNEDGTVNKEMLADIIAGYDTEETKEFLEEFLVNNLDKVIGLETKIQELQEECTQEESNNFCNER